ncbi:MAG: hypothetical protein ACHQDY_04305 [Solirubrobacterales bacterium]
MLATAVFGALALGMSACESTESESAKLGREGAKLIAGSATVGLGASNSQVRVGQAVLVQSSGRVAAAVQLTNTGVAPQVNVPVLIDVRGAKGASLYRNDIQGLEPSLQAMPLLGPHRQGWWVDDQVLASAPTSVQVRVGASRGSGAGASGGTGAGATSAGGGTGAGGGSVRLDVARAALLAPSAVHASFTGLGSEALAGPYMTGTVTNRSGVALHNTPIFAVALRGGRVVAAGRALVPSLPASAAARPTSFRIYFVGSPAGAHIELTPAPTVAQ